MANEKRKGGSTTKRRVVELLRRVIDPETGETATLEALADAAGVSVKTVQRWLDKSEPASLPHLLDVVGLSKRFGLSADELLGLPERRAPSEVKALQQMAADEVLARLGALAPRAGERLASVSRGRLGEAIVARFVRDATLLEASLDEQWDLLHASSALQHARGEDSPSSKALARLERANHARVESLVYDLLSPTRAATRAPKPRKRPARE
ncbi:MAG: hypothetical protein HEQ38_20605 [Gemmatimonas sp.]|nr:hypothetical protein [Gemmatimonas sp.]